MGLTTNTWEPYRDVLKSKEHEIYAGISLARVDYGEPGASNDAVNAIGQRTKTHYSGVAYPTSLQGKSEYAYNANGEVVSAARTDATGTPLVGRSRGFTFDPIGNRLTATIDGNISTNYAPTNPLNQYTAITQGATTTNPLHDPDGNLVNDGSKKYLWDAENRLVEVRRASDDAEIASYRYDYMSRRVYKKTTAVAPQGAGETVFHYEGWNLMAEYLVNGASLATLRTYTWGLDLSGSLQGAGGVGGLLVMETKAAPLAERYVYPFYDGNGNVTGLIQGDYTAHAVNAYEYDAFGNLASKYENTSVEIPFGFSTKYFDKETGFYYYGYRYYDPVTGRWPSRDPIEEEGGVNLYGFVLNEPVDGYDYLGLDRPSTPKMSDCNTCFSAAAHKAGEEALKKSELEYNTEKEKARKAGKPFEWGRFPIEYGGRVCLKVGSCGEESCYTTEAKGKTSAEAARDSKGKHMGEVDPSDAPDCEKGDRQIGWWHTHPGASDGKGGFGLGPWISPNDRSWVDGLTNGLPKPQNRGRLPIAMTRQDTRTGPETFIYEGSGKYCEHKKK